MLDRNFDDIAYKFSGQIYATTKGKIREHILNQEIAKITEKFHNKQLIILDAGGGQAQISCNLAKQGHQVIVCDISKNMLQIAKDNALKAQCSIEFIHDSIQNLHKHLTVKVDVILCHAVLEWVFDPEQILQILKQHLKSGGYISLMFYNYYSLLFKNIIFGNFQYTVDKSLIPRKKRTISPDHPRKPEEIEAILKTLNFTMEDKIGIRIFHDYLLNLDITAEQFAALLKLEKKYNQHPAYINLARYMHYTLTNV